MIQAEEIISESLNENEEHLARIKRQMAAVGYRSGGGWFVWPGGLGLLVMLLLLYFFFGRN